jgi:hypothetical protein
MARSVVPVDRPEWATLIPAGRPVWAEPTPEGRPESAVFDYGLLVALVTSVGCWVLLALTLYWLT